MILDFKTKGEKPTFINDETQEKWEQHWNDLAVIRRSAQNSRNHCGATDAFRPFTHTSRSISYAKISDKLVSIIFISICLKLLH